MVPVLDRPVMEHIVDLLDSHSFEQVIANLHYFPDTIRESLRRAPSVSLRARAARHGGGRARLRGLLRR
jgi:NDP-sugar pyrophosphorylase family protein